MCMLAVGNDELAVRNDDNVLLEAAEGGHVWELRKLMSLDKSSGKPAPIYQHS